MNGLLRANFARLWRTKALWLGIALPSAYNIFFLLIIGASHDIYNSINEINSMSLFFSAVFAVLYIGTEHSDKTIKNKIIVGVSRVKVYFANLITVAVGMAVIFAGNWLVVTVYNLANGGNLKQSAGQLAMYMVICLIAGVAMMAVCTLLAMLVPSKALAAALTIVLVIGMYYSRQLLLKLKTVPDHVIQMQDDINEDHIIVDEYYDDRFVVSEGVYNAAQIAYNFFPESQIVWAGSFMGHLQIVFGELTMYSLGLTAAATTIGIAAFRRKDLK